MERPLSWEFLHSAGDVEVARLPTWRVIIIHSALGAPFAGAEQEVASGEGAKSGERRSMSLIHTTGAACEPASWFFVDVDPDE